MPDQTTTIACPKCAAEFTPKRSDQKYCSRPCVKAASRNAARGPRNDENKRANEEHYNRARDLAEMLYTAPVEERLGIMNVNRHANLTPVLG